jgi:hypothetical protein
LLYWFNQLSNRCRIKSSDYAITFQKDCFLLIPHRVSKNTNAQHKFLGRPRDKWLNAGFETRIGHNHPSLRQIFLDVGTLPSWFFDVPKSFSIHTVVRYPVA